MAITGWIHPTRDLRDERPAVNAMAVAFAAGVLRRDVVRLARRSAFAHLGLTGGYADWRHPERPDPDLALAIDGQLSNRTHLDEQLYGRPRPLSGDAEVLLHAYRAWGVGLVDRIAGTYAIAIWDNLARQLLLIRDPLGARTLFYSVVDGGIVFATRATALLAHPAVNPVVDADGLNELLTLGPVRTPGHGVVDGVAEVLPAELIQAGPGGLRRRYYWYLEADDSRHDADTAVQVVRRALAETTAATRTRRAGAVLLSGGVASATAAVYAAGMRGHRLAAWTLALTGPPELPGDVGADVEQAERAAGHLRLRHNMLAIGRDTLLDTAPGAREALDFPGEAGADALLLAVLRRIAAAGSTGVVTGHGADAVFGGYRWLHDSLTLATDDFPWPGVGDPADLLNADARHHLMPGLYRQHRYEQATLGVPHLTGADALGRRRRTMAYLTLTRYLPHLLTRLGQLADAAGVTLHTPFVDWLFAAYLFNTPTGLRHLLGVPNGLLRHAVSDLLPAETTWLRPRPFPSAELLDGWQQSRTAQLRDILDDPEAPLRPLLDRGRVTELLVRPAGPVSDRAPATVAYLVDVNAWLLRHHISLT
ncbi:asparagine synthetase B family protein [Paractinoplanes hotanensis]|uniref:asparagine synthase (glutamine-hydrolyzing) n=1 Tax=Paractinoplanes hotanensis TaxID=2906497 RepID=A0ABT0YF68_9ACTN|nr:asparagine synthase-related protein [Actinoplanes hotanensis]MCM4083914.1 asparagine synthase-related protein [Actinoplanes hotanensis]